MPGTPKPRVEPVLRRFIYNERQHLLFVVLRLALSILIFVILGLSVDFRNAHVISSSSYRGVLPYENIGVRNKNTYRDITNYFTNEFGLSFDEYSSFAYLNFDSSSWTDDYWYSFVDIGLSSSVYPLTSLKYTQMLGGTDDTPYSDQYAIAWGLATVDIRKPSYSNVYSVDRLIEGPIDMVGRFRIQYKVGFFETAFAGLLIVATIFISLPVVGAPIAEDNGESGMKAFLYRIGIRPEEYWSAWVVYAISLSTVTALVSLITYPLNRLPFVADHFPSAIVFILGGVVINLLMAFVLSLICRNSHTYMLTSNLLYAVILLIGLTLMSNVENEEFKFIDNVASWVTFIPPLVVTVLAVNLNIIAVKSDDHYTISRLLFENKFSIAFTIYVLIGIGMFVALRVRSMFRRRRVYQEIKGTMDEVEFDESFKDPLGDQYTSPKDIHPVRKRFLDSADEEHVICSDSRRAFNEGATVVISHLGKAFPPSLSSRIMNKISRKSEDLSPTIGVSDVSLALRPGITALLARSGGGKSVTINCLSGVYGPSKGSIKFAPTERGQIGLCPQQNVHWDDLTVDQHLRIFQAIYSTETDETILKKARVDLLETMDIHMCIDQAAKTLSGGQQRRLSLAIALIGNPSLCILDEVSSGLDKVSSRALQQLIVDIAKEQNRTILLTTHSFEEATRMCDEVAIIQNRVLAAKDSVNGLISRLPREQRVSVFWENGRNVENEAAVLSYIESKVCGIVNVFKSTRRYTEFSITSDASRSEWDLSVAQMHGVFDNATKTQFGISTWSILPISLREVMVRIFGENLDV